MRIFGLTEAREEADFLDETKEDWRTMEEVEEAGRVSARSFRRSKREARLSSTRWTRRGIAAFARESRAARVNAAGEVLFRTATTERAAGSFTEAKRLPLST